MLEIKLYTTGNEEFDFRTMVFNRLTQYSYGEITKSLNKIIPVKFVFNYPGYSLLSL